MTHTNWTKIGYVDYKRFIKLSNEFQEAAKEAFNTEEINTTFTLRNSWRKASNNPWNATVFKSNNSANQQNTILIATKLSDITEALFMKSTCIEINIRPKQEIENRFAYASALIKQPTPNIASFYIQ